MIGFAKNVYLFYTKLKLYLIPFLKFAANLFFTYYTYLCKLFHSMIWLHFET